MKTNILATAVALSDHDLLARIDVLALIDRETTAELVAHLAALELRPSLYLAQGYGSLYDYCTGALRLSEDAACSRIGAVRACMRFPVLLGYLASGAMTLTSVRLLGPHLTPENHEAVLARAQDKARKEIEALVAELAPRPDVPASVRRLPEPKVAVVGTEAGSNVGTDTPLTGPQSGVLWAAGAMAGTETSPVATIDEDGRGAERPALQAPPIRPPDPRPIVEVLAPHRYRVQFTIGQQAHDDLRTLQALLRREVPRGDPGAIFERALALLRKEVEKAKLGVGANPRRTGGARPQSHAYEKRIRFRTDKNETTNSGSTSDVGSELEPARLRHERSPCRHVPNAVKRAVWYRDRGQCAFVSTTGRRCVERNFLELHHIQPYALKGPATEGNIALRCRRHNQYEAELIFGPRGVSSAKEGSAGEGSGR